MVQDQLVDYIASQLKIGVSKETVKSALVGVGWSAQDVDDTFKKIEGGSTAVASPAASRPAAIDPIVINKPTSGTTPAFAETTAGRQNIRVSDLVSASLTPTTSAGLSQASMSGGMAATKGPQKISMGSGPSMIQSSRPMGKGMFVMIGIILILAGTLAYLYFQNGSLSAELQTKNGQNSGSASQVSDLNTQVQALNASNTALSAQIATLTANVQELQADLSLIMVPTGQSAATPVAVMVAGMLSGGKPTYVLTTAQGVKVYVKNSTDANVKTALDPLVGQSSVKISGMHNPGSSQVTVSEVNGVAVNPPVAPVATTTATTTTSSTLTATSTTGQ